MFLYISEILGRLIVDAEGQAIGKLVNLKVRLGELFPKVVTLVVKKRKTQRMFELDWQEVQSLNTAEIPPAAWSRRKISAHGGQSPGDSSPGRAL